MDNNIEDPGAVFTIPDLWGPPRCLQISQDQSSFLFSQLKIADIDNAVPNSSEHAQPNEGFFSIPDLSLGPPGDTPKATQSLEPVEDVVAVLEEGDQDDVDDFWILKEEEPLKEACYQSWDAFDNKGVKEAHTPYITEAGPAIFNANLRIGNTSHLMVDSRTYSSSLLALGLGRSSIFFTWSENKQSFEQTLPQIRVTGYSADSLQGLVAIFKECGSITRYLQLYVDRTYVKTKSAGQVALANAISTLLTTIQTRLSTSASTHQSLLQLKALFLPAHSVLTCFYRITKNVSSTKTDEAMLSIIFEEIQLLEHRTDSLRDILLQILTRVSRPWLEFSGEWLGLRRESGLPVTKEGTGKNFVKVEDKEWIDEQGFELQESDYALDYDMIPSFIAPDDARSMFEVGRSLRFLRTHHTEHPLAKMDIVASAQPPSLEWKFSWQDIMQVEAKALQYEKDLKAAIQQFSTDTSNVRIFAADNDVGKTFELNFFGKPEQDMKAHVLASIDAFERPLSDNASPDELSQVLTTYLSSAGGVTNDDSIFAPPVSLTPVLSFNPIISTQARIINNTCMRLFFDSHKLREHLSIQRSFHLLGNGVFSSRLSHALFDPELETAERQRGIARSGGVMGLRLGGRDTWPPASSELRLALMGVLTESYVSAQSLDRSREGVYIDRSPTLPGDLSFAVRDMSPEEIDACMDPNSVEALDFLRLSYKPPAPLEAIITPIILYKYDQLFKLLLRVIRMLYVVSALFRDATDRTSHWQGIDYVAQRFRIEAQHFVSSISGYFFDTGIEATWQVFENKLDQVEERIHSKDSNVTLGHNEGLDKLRDYHERVLDRIMFALFLRKRQQPILKLLEEIFTLILQFAKHSRERALAVKRDITMDDEVREMYRRFRKKVGVFIAVCRSLSEKKGYGEKRSMEGQSMGQGGLFDGHDLAEENTIVQLLTRLEMSDYYSKAVRA